MPALSEEVPFAMRPHLLIIDQNVEAAEHFVAHFPREFTAEIVPSLLEGAEHCAHIPCDLLFIDINTALRDESQLLALKQHLPASTKMALITDLHMEQYLHLLQRWAIYNVIAKAPAYDTNELHRMVIHLLDPAQAFGLRRHLAPSSHCFTATIRDRHQRKNVIEQITGYFNSLDHPAHDLNDVRLLLEEAINNALYHGFENHSGEKKYHAPTFVALEPHETISVEYGSDDRSLGFTVTDTGGILTPTVIIEKLRRQVSREGLLDESGRGIYLSHALADKFIVNIENHKRTQTVVIFFPRQINPYKSLHIHYLE
jgi:anti-sigma regulatory factor (Ser/Thr protein kinase)